MGLVGSLVLTAFLLNHSQAPVDSLKTISTYGVNNLKQSDLSLGEVVVVVVVNEKSVKYTIDSGKLKAGKVKFVPGIRFAIGETKLNNSVKDELTKFSDILIKNPSTRIAIVGHTDKINSLELNQKLSKNRAQAVADFLLSKNVLSTQLKEISGKNYSEPLADNSTKAGRAANRRAEVFIVLSPTATNSSGKMTMQADSIKNKPVPASLIKLVNQVIKQPIHSTDIEIEIDGLLVDDTKTKAGKDFYDLFYNNWEAPAAAKNYSITLSERPFRLTSTLIVISINDDIIYQDILQPREELIETQTIDAIYIAQNYLINYAEISKQMNGDDQSGTGIY